MRSRKEKVVPITRGSGYGRSGVERRKWEIRKRPSDSIVLRTEEGGGEALDARILSERVEGSPMECDEESP